MPIYDYVCTSCRHRFEVFHGLNEAGPHQCPLCEGPVTRAFAPPTIVFKGSGWAKVDRRSTSAPAKRGRSSEGSSDDRPPAAASSGASTGSSDAKGGASEAASSSPTPSPGD